MHLSWYLSFSFCCHVIVMYIFASGLRQLRVYHVFMFLEFHFLNGVLRL